MRVLSTLVLMLLSGTAVAGDPPTARLRCPPVVNLKFTPVQAYTVSGVTVVNRPLRQLGTQAVRVSTLPIVAPVAVVRNTSSMVRDRFGERTPIVVMPMVRYGITSGQMYSSGCSNGSCGTVSRFGR